MQTEYFTSKNRRSLLKTLVCQEGGISFYVGCVFLKYKTLPNFGVFFVFFWGAFVLFFGCLHNRYTGGRIMVMSMSLETVAFVLVLVLPGFC